MLTRNHRRSSDYRVGLVRVSQFVIRVSGLMNGLTRYINRDNSVVSRIANSVISLIKGTVGILIISVLLPLVYV